MGKVIMKLFPLSLNLYLSLAPSLAKANPEEKEKD
jgi:hypothetical protein